MSNPKLVNALQKIAEQKIQSAIDEGKFEKVEGFGKPLEFDNLYDPNWWIKNKCKLENLSVLPPALELKKQVSIRMQKLLELDDEEQVRAGVDELNEYIQTHNRQILWGPPSQVLNVDPNKFVMQWKSHRENGDNDESGAAPDSMPNN